MIDYLVWDLKNEFTFNEAAHLWYEVNPFTPPSDIPKETITKIKTFNKVLKEMALNSKISGVTFVERPFIGGGLEAVGLSRAGLKIFAERMGQKPKFLFPEDREKQGSLSNQENQVQTFVHSKDFRSVTWKGESFTFTSRQAQVIEMLYNAFKTKTPCVGKDRILEDLDSPSSRLRDTFKNSPAWKTLIIAGERRGTYRLNI